MVPSPRPDSDPRPRSVRASASNRDLPEGQRGLPTPELDYSVAFAKAPQAILIANADRKYVEVNEAACVLTGFGRDELLSMQVGDLTVPAERVAAEQHFDELSARGRSSRVATLVRKDGRTLTVESLAVALGSGLYLGVLIDLSDRLSTRQDQQPTSEAIGDLFDLCEAALVSADEQGRIVSWSPAAQRMFGHRASAAIGRPISELIVPEDRERYAQAFHKRVGSEDPKRFARKLYAEGLRTDGSRMPVELYVSVGRHGQEKVFMAVIRDLSEHRAVIERLNDALQRLQFHVQRMPLAYIVWDVGFKVMEWNPAAERMFGYSRVEALGKSAMELIVPPDAVATVDNIWNNLLKGDTSSHSINANVRKDGSRLTCEWFNTPLHDSDGRIHGVCSMAMDVSEREAMEAQIRDAQKLESLGVLAGGVAHDFNSALMVILGNTSLLRSIPQIPARALTHIELIEDACHRASEFVRHLLAYARTGRHNPQPTDLNALAAGSIEFLRTSFGNQCEIVFRPAPDLPKIIADHGQLEQILLNLCLNAKQASPVGAVIEVRTRRCTISPRQRARCVPPHARSGEHVELSVSDPGCGMDAATVSRIFDPFFTTKKDGHGLGLAAVLGILRQHEACAQVESSPGKGTTMHVFFPVTPDAA